MQKNTLFDSNLSTDSFTKINEFEEGLELSHLLSYKLPAYIPAYNQSFGAKTQRNFSKTPDSHCKRTKNPNKSVDQRQLKINFEKPQHKIMGDLDNLLGCSTISDVYLKSSGILAQTIKSKYFSNNFCNSELDFIDVESQIPNTNSTCFESVFNEMNVISSILIKSNKESSDFIPKKQIMPKKRAYKIEEKEFSLPHETTEISKQEQIFDVDIDVDEILNFFPDYIGQNEINKILDYFDIQQHSEGNTISFKDDLYESLASLAFENNLIIEDQLNEIFSNSSEKSFEMPVISSVKTSNVTQELNQSETFPNDELKIITEDENEQQTPLQSPKFMPDFNISDSLEIENIISKSSMVEENNNLYFSFAEIINQENIHNNKKPLEDKENNNSTLEKLDSFSQYFFKDKSSFHSFYESIVHSQSNSKQLSSVQKKQKGSFIETKENKETYIKKIISSTNSKAKKPESLNNKKKGNQQKTMNSGNLLLDKDKKSLNFKKNKNVKSKFEKIY